MEKLFEVKKKERLAVANSWVNLSLPRNASVKQPLSLYESLWLPCSVMLAGLLSIAAVCPVGLFAQKSHTARVQLVDDQPVLLVDEKPELPFFYALTHVSGGRWSWEELPAHNLRHMAALGVRLYQVDLWLADLWPENGRPLDLNLARRQLRGVLDACPGAAIVVRLHVNAPAWWNRRHPEECVQFANGPLQDLPEGLPFNHEDGDPDRASRASLASVRWRAEAGARTAEFCRRLARSPEGRAVIGFHVSGGVYGEWHPWGFIKHEPDVSEPMQQAFRQWLARKYGTTGALRAAWGDSTAAFATATVPDSLARRCCRDTGSIFRDPVAERYLLDFYHCQQEIVAADIEYFCRTVKENWPRPLVVGVFYGYLHFSLCRHALSGHLAIRQLIDSPWIDYFAGPPSYWADGRKVGGSGLQRGVAHSMRLHGKLWFDEVDNGYLQNKREQDFVRSLPLGDSAYLTVLQRSLWLPLVQGQGLWLYDFGPRRNTGWWDGEMYRNEIRRTLDFFRRDYGRRSSASSPAGDALVVWDTESFYHVENRWSRSCERGLDAATEDLQRAGVALQHIYAFDLPRVDLDRYRAVIFMNAWLLTPEQRRFIRDSVAGGDRTLVWNYLAGYSDGHDTGQSLAESATGFLLQKTTPASDTIRWEMNGTLVDTPEKKQPLFVIRDPGAEGLGHLSRPDSGQVVVARKKQAGHTVVCATVPLHGPAVWRSILQSAGCIVYSESADPVYAAGDRLLVHTADGGHFFQVEGLPVPLGQTGRPATRLWSRTAGSFLLK